MGACVGVWRKPGREMGSNRMNDEGFWQIIDASRRDFDPALRDGNMERQATLLREHLDALGLEELQEFRLIFDRLFWRAYRWDLWAAAFIIGSGCSDDSFHDFRDWLISMGREAYEAALADPETLARVVKAPGIEDAFFEGFGSIAQQAIEDRGAEPADDREERPSTPAGATWTTEELPTLYPGLWATFGRT